MQFLAVRTIFAPVRRLRHSVRASLFTLIVSVLVIGLNFGTGVLTARLLGSSGRGEMAAMGLWPHFLASAMSLGLPSAIVYCIRRTPQNESALVGMVFLIGTLMSVVLAASGIAFIPYWMDQYDPAVIRFAQIMMLCVPIPLLGTLLNAVLQTRGEFGLYNRFRYLVPLLTLIGLVTLHLLGRLDPFTATATYIVASVPTFVWGLVWVWRHCRPRIAAPRRTAQQLMGYGARSYGIDLLGTLTQQVDYVLLVTLVSSGQFGLYMVARSLAMVLEVFHGAIVPVLFPKASGLAQGDAVAMATLAARINMVVTAVAAAGLFLVAPLLLTLFYSAEFAGAAPAFRILVVDAVISSTVHVLAQAFMAVGRPGMVAFLQSVGLAAVVPLTLVLVPIYGLQGAALALLVASLCRMGFLLLCFPLVLKIRPPNLWPALDDFRMLLRPGEGRRA